MLLAVSGGLASIRTNAQIILNQTQTPNVLVQNVLMGSGVFASNVTFNGDPGSVVAPLFTTLGQIGRFNGTNCNLDLPGGVFLCTNDASTHIPGPNDLLLQLGGGLGGGGFWNSPDLDLSQLTGDPNWFASGGSNIGNRSVLEFDFVPIKDMISVRYVFSSEEYERWACSQYNDVFGFFLSGPGINGPFANNAINLALVPGSNSRVSINTINSGLMDANNANGPWTDAFVYCTSDPNWQSNAQYYRSFGGQWPYPQPGGGAPQLAAPYNTDPYYIQHNGMTVVLTASAAVQCGQSYHIKMGIGNVNDNWFPSAVFLEQGSFTSSDRFSMDVAPGPNVEYAANDTILIESDCDSVHLQFRRWGGFYLDEYLQISTGGSATSAVDYLQALPDSIHFSPFDSLVVVPIAVPLDADGLEDLVVNIITCNGAKIQTYNFTIDQRDPLMVTLDDVDLDCPAVVLLTPEVTGGSNDPAAFTYLWSTGESTPTISPYVDQTTQFWVTVSDSCWAFPVTDSAWVTLPPYDPMVLTLTPDTAIPCLGNADLEVVAALGSGGYTYAWTQGGAVQGTDPTLNVTAPIAPLYYVAHVTDLCGVVTSDSVLVSQAPPVPLVITLSPDTAIPCLGTADLEVVVSGGGGVISQSWTDGAGTLIGTGASINVPAAVLEVYQVEVTDQCGQSMTGQVVVTTGPTPPLLLHAEGDTVLCADMPLLLQVIQVTGGGGTYSYAWSPPGTGNNDGPTLEVRVADDAFFTVTVTDQCGNTADTTLLAMVEDHDPLELVTSNDTTVCPGEQVSLWAQVSGGAGGHTFNWPGLGAGDTVQWTAGHDDHEAQVIVTDACGETVSGTVQLAAYPAQVWITATDHGDSNWSFQARMIPTTGNELEWDLGDGTTAQNASQVSHQYDDMDAHWVYLYMVTEQGCLAVDSIRTTPPEATIYFPNAFSPNGDGINETFGGEGALLDRYELWVFDRWGRIIFQSNDLVHRWDGTQDGEQVMNGVYQYKYLVKGQKLPLAQGLGHVVLLR
jgi:gliding motility-associated-like protein